MKKIKIFYYCIEEVFKINEYKINKVIAKITQDYKCQLNRLNLIFTNDQELLIINKKYLNRDSYTDIISFNYSEREKEIDSELYMSNERIQFNSKKYKVTFEKEQNRVIIHGILHIVGEKDDNKKNKSRMKKKENYYLKYVSRETFED